MVLTQLFGTDTLNPSLTVSIPLWFLRNDLAGEILASGKMFPYHYGSYATRGCLMNYGFQKFRFHTTMVLTQRGSIQFHSGILLGFHTTMVLTQRIEKYSRRSYPCVSIPLWFLRNYITGGELWMKAIVSIPLWFSRNLAWLETSEMPEHSFHTTMVLTQPSMA